MRPPPALAGVTLLLVVPAGAQDGSAIMDRAARTYRGLSSFSAEFRQVAVCRTSTTCVTTYC